MISVKLKRIGKKKKPFYHLIVTEKLSYIKGKYIEKLGYFDPIEKNSNFNVDRIIYWKKQGALISKRIQHLIKMYNKNEQ